MNLVEKTVKGVEDELEFLFVPCGALLSRPFRRHLTPHVPLCRYSVFTVISISIPAKITGGCSTCGDSLCCARCDAVAAGTYPVVVHIEAAIDNADEDDGLPLAPWH